jgi:hypothetical protein
MQRVETVINLLWILAGGAVCAYAVQLGLTDAFGPGSGLFPLLAGLAMAIAGVGLLVAKSHRIPEGSRFWTERGAASRVTTLVSLLVAFLLALPWIGFVLAGLMATPLMMQTVERTSWLFAVVVGWSATVAIYVLFVPVLHTQLPRGPLGF